MAVCVCVLLRVAVAVAPDLRCCPAGWDRAGNLLPAAWRNPGAGGKANGKGKAEQSAIFAEDQSR